MRHLLLFALILFLSLTTNSAVNAQVFWEDNFEGTTPNMGGGVREAPNHANSTDGSNTDICGPSDYFFRTDCNATSSTPGQNCDGVTDVFTGSSGFMWRGEDLDGCLADPDIINFSGISISGRSNLVFKGLFACDDDPNDWEGVGAADGHPDQLLVSYQIDGGGYTTGIVFRSDGSDNNNTGDNRGVLRVDTDDDGFGDGPLALGLAFQEFSFSIPGGGSTLDLRFEAYVNNGGEEFAIDLFQVEEGVDPLVCPTLGSISLSENTVCANSTFGVSITGLANMASATNNDQDYGIAFVAFDGITADPYEGGTNLGTVPFVDLTGTESTATISGASLATAGDYTVFAILSPQPGDLSCRPSVVTNLTVLAVNTLTLTSPGGFCINDPIQTGLTGGSPTGGVYSGPGVTDDGNGMTYSFDPAVAGVGMQTITYMNGDCDSDATASIEVFAAPTVAFTPNTNTYTLGNAYAGNTGGSPEGGVYSGPGVTDNGNGMSYTFNADEAGLGAHMLTYTYADENGCSGSATATVTVTGIVACPEGDITLLSQADVDAYVAAYPNCPEIAGNLKIGNGSSTTDISDLSGLSNLTTIGGNFFLFFNDNLSSLQGFDALTSVGGGLYIFRNNGLTSLSGLQSLSTIGDDLYLLLNDNLNSLSGVNSLTSIGGNLIIRKNTGLLDLTGLDMLGSIGGFLDISSNASLSSLSSLSALTSINGNLVIRDNESLTSLQGLENIDPGSIAKLFVVGNTSLSECAIESICVYLGDATNFANIARNAERCNNRSRVESACSVMSLAAATQAEVQAVNTTELSSGKTEIPQVTPAIKLFPNPTSGRLQVRNVDAQRVLVFNPQGQRVAIYEAPGSELDMSTLPAGVYYLSFVTAENRYTVRVVKMDQ